MFAIWSLSFYIMVKLSDQKFRKLSMLREILFSHTETPSSDLNLYHSILTHKECDGSRTVTVKYMSLL